MHIFSVHTLTQAVKDVLEGKLPFVWVCGDLPNLSKPLSRRYDVKQGLNE